MKKCILIIFSVLYCTTQHANERPIVVVIPSYNNAEWYQRNLDSVFEQNYSNYRIIYINDCSTDDTYTLVHKHIDSCNQWHRVTLLHNTERRGALANHYRAVHMCDDLEIVVQLDGDDSFKHANALATINQAYEDPNVWLTYGQYETHPPDNKPLKSRPMPPIIIRNNAYREYDWITSAPRTFYACLFKQIRLESFLIDSQFFSTTCDLACMFPMLEMAAGRIHCISDIIYVYNCQTPNNDCKRHLQKQLHAGYVIRAQKKYQRLEQLPISSMASSDHSVSCLILSADTPTALAQSLSSVDSYVHGNATIAVLYTASHDTIASSYRQLLNNYPSIIHIQATPTTYKYALTKILDQIETRYLLLTCDDYAFINSVDLTLCSRMLDQTKAHGFYLALDIESTIHPLLERNQEIPPYTHIQDTICAWQFYTGDYAWREHATLAMCIYTTQDIQKACQETRFNSLTTFADAWYKQAIDMQSVGLFFKHTPVRKSRL